MRGDFGGMYDVLKIFPTIKSELQAAGTNISSKKSEATPQRYQPQEIKSNYPTWKIFSMCFSADEKTVFGNLREV